VHFSPQLSNPKFLFSKIIKVHLKNKIDNDYMCEEGWWNGSSGRVKPCVQIPTLPKKKVNREMQI
jgi:hypothetical protein